MPANLNMQQGSPFTCATRFLLNTTSNKYTTSQQTSRVDWAFFASNEVMWISPSFWCTLGFRLVQYKNNSEFADYALTDVYRSCLQMPMPRTACVRRRGVVGSPSIRHLSDLALPRLRMPAGLCSATCWNSSSCVPQIPLWDQVTRILATLPMSSPGSITSASHKAFLPMLCRAPCCTRLMRNCSAYLVQASVTMFRLTLYSNMPHRSQEIRPSLRANGIDHCLPMESCVVIVDATWLTAWYVDVERQILRVWLLVLGPCLHLQLSGNKSGMWFGILHTVYTSKHRPNCRTGLQIRNRQLRLIYRRALLWHSCRAALSHGRKGIIRIGFSLKYCFNGGRPSNSTTREHPETSYLGETRKCDWLTEWLSSTTRIVVETTCRYGNLVAVCQVSKLGKNVEGMMRLPPDTLRQMSGLLFMGRVGVLEQRWTGKLVNSKRCSPNWRLSAHWRKQDSWQQQICNKWHGCYASTNYEKTVPAWGIPGEIWRQLVNPNEYYVRRRHGSGYDGNLDTGSVGDCLFVLFTSIRLYDVAPIQWNLSTQQTQWQASV